jgi:hypothetical protein
MAWRQRFSPLVRRGRGLADPAILDTHVRSHAAVNRLEGVGMFEAPRGVLIHHYKTGESVGRPDCRHGPQQPGHQPQQITSKGPAGEVLDRIT